MSEGELRDGVAKKKDVRARPRRWKRIVIDYCEPKSFSTRYSEFLNRAESSIMMFVLEESNSTRVLEGPVQIM